MESSPRSPRILLYFVIITVTAFMLITCISLAFLLLSGCRIVPMDLWPIMEAVATALGTALIVGAGYLAYQELKEVGHSRHLEIANELFAELNSDENIAARRWVFQNLQGDPAQTIPTLTAEGRSAIKHVLNSMDRAALLTQKDWIPEEMIMPWMSVMIVKAWTKLEPYILYERERRHEPDYYRSAQVVSERCMRWRARHVPDAQVIWMDDAL